MSSIMVPFSRACFGHSIACFISLVYISRLIRRIMVRNLLGLSYAYMELTIGKSLSFTMFLSNGTESALITSNIYSIDECLLTQLVST